MAGIDQLSGGSVETRLLLEELAQLKTGGKPGEFAGAATRLRSQLKEIRAALDGLISPLHAYLTGAFGSFDSRRVNASSSPECGTR